MSDWATREIPRPNAFIQWKGTNVCMDFYCLCGGQFHLDVDFAYAVECPGCHRIYEMSAKIEARETTRAEYPGSDAKMGEEFDPPDEEEERACGSQTR